MSLWTGPGAARTFGAPPKGPAHLEAVERVKDWTRRRFALSEADALLLAEAPCALPGFPPMETVVAFWGADGRRHHFKVFKRVEEVEEGDIPPPWMKDALAESDGASCACC